MGRPSQQATFRSNLWRPQGLTRLALTYEDRLFGRCMNIVGAFVGLLVIGPSQFSLGLVQAVSFAASQLVMGLQQQLYGLSGLFADFGQLAGIVGIVTVGGAQFGSTLANLRTFSVLINISLAVLKPAAASSSGWWASSLLRS